MKNSNFFKKYKLIIILVIILIPVIIFSKNIVSFLGNLFESGGEVLNLIKSNDQVDGIEEKEPIIKIKPETPGALRFIDRLIKVEKDSLSTSSVIEETNAARLKNNLPLLKENKLLNLSAEKKLKDILENQYFEHVSPSGVGIENLSEEVGYGYILIGENLAMGNFKDEKALVDAWMGSFGHRKNILKPNYEELGVAISKGVFKGEEVWVAVQHFGTPKSACPRVNENLSNVVTFNQQQIETLNEDLGKRLIRIKSSRGFGGSDSPDYIKKIEEYNNLVIYYNNLVDQVKEDITTYNNQVKLFNECVKKYQD